MAVLNPAQTFILTESDPALQRDFGNTIQTTISPLSENAVIFINTSSVLNSYTNIIGGVASGNTGEIQFNIAGSFGADAGLIYNPINNVLGVGGALVSGIVVTDSLLHANGEPWNFVNPTASAGGLNTQLQFNNSNALGGIPDIQYFSGNNVLSLGDLSNLRIAGGATGQFITTDGVGNLTFVDSFPLAAGNDTEIQFNNASITAGAANFTYDPNTEVVGVASLTVSTTAIISNLIVNSNITGGNITISGRSTLTGNVSTGNLTSNNINATSIIANANITAGNTINAARANISANATIGSISTGAISANGNINFTGANVTLGPVGNVRITGGSSGQVLRTDGTGTLSWSSPSSSGAAGTNTQIQFNDANLIAGANNLTYNKITQTLTANKLVVSTQANLGAAGNVIITGGAKSNAVLGAVSFNGSGAITNIAVTTGGSGYDLPPVITISGSNTSPATAAAVLDSATGTVLSVTIVTAGLGYNVGSPTATIAPPGTKFLSTDGAGNLSWRENGSTGGGGASPSSAGPNTAVQFNDGGVIGGSSAFVFNKTTGLVTVSNNLSVVGNISVANLSVSANAAFSGANVSLGAIANLRITGGSANQFLQTDGSGTLTFAAIDQSQISNGNSNVKVAANSVVTINASGASGTWTFGTDAVLTFPNQSQLVTQGALTQLNSANSGFIVLDAKNSSNVSTSSVINDGTNAAVFIKTVQLPAAIDNFWAFSNTGNLSFPANGSLILGSNNGTAVRQISIKSSTNANFTANYTLTLPVDDGANGQFLATDGSGVLSWITPVSGSSLSNGNSNVTVAFNGNIAINANASSNEQWVFATDGTVAFPGNTLQAKANTPLDIRTTNGNAYTSFYAEAGNYTATGIQDNTTGSNPGYGYVGVNMADIDAPTAFIILQAADTGSLVGWGFDALGHFSIPSNGAIDFLNNNGSAIKQVSLKASSDANFTANYTLTLPVNDGANGQVLTTDGSGILSWTSTSPSSISNGNSNATVALNGNITINANAGSNEQWIFGTNGTTQFPANTLEAPANSLFTIRTTNGNAYTSFAAQANSNISMGIEDDTTGVNDAWAYFEAGMANVNTPEAFVTVRPADTGTEVSWNFDALGNLTLPNGGKIRSNNSIININTTVDDAYTDVDQSASIWEVHVEDDVTGANPAYAWLRAELPTVDTPEVFIENKRGNDGIELRWSFDSTANLTLPGGSVLSPSGTDLENIDLIAGANGYAQLQSNDANSFLWVDNDGAYIRTNWTDVGRQWTFDVSGDTTLPTGGSLDFVSSNGSALHRVTIQSSTNANFNANYILTLPVNDGTSGQYLQTDGTGVLSWQTVSVNTSSISNGNSNVSVAANSNVTITSAGNTWTFDTAGNFVLPTNTANINYANGSPYIAIPTSIVNGNSNVVVAANANVTISANGTDDLITIVSSGGSNPTTAGLVANGFVFATNMISNAYIFGNSTTTVSRMGWLGAATSSTAANQILYTSPSANISSVDFHITATGVTGSGESRQVAKVLAVTRNSTTNFTEYGGMFVGANLGDFNVIQSGSNLALVVTPTTANSVQYNVILTTYF
jgi:hypothetical protein